MAGQAKLSPREREIMDAVCSRDKASESHVFDAMQEPPTKAAVRTMLPNLIEKVLSVSERSAATCSIRQRVHEIRPGTRQFDASCQLIEGSLEQAASAHLADENVDLCEDELKCLSTPIQKNSSEGNLK
ncbi:MAG: BlaI/MecI/CopY family transcriptional regulator [Planctomycetaceae bacterium]|jgi:predicted transcriptional regulator|nr:BlaI/MecI/CopY family transcriptional regulator [Planctomycetaceae bacterium]